MKQRPILFSGPMIRVLLAGTKTQTRRVVKPQPVANQRGKFNFMTFTDDEGIESYWQNYPFWGPVRCPYGQPGDRLWVREAWRIGTDNDCACYEPCGQCVVGKPMYAANFSGEVSEWGPWKPSIHMPRAASRITLEITAVRVERLQDISEADAKAEGTTPIPDPCDHVRQSCADIGCSGPQPYRVGFRALWQQINGPDSWDANPWVWVVEFRKC